MSSSNQKSLYIFSYFSYPLFETKDTYFESEEKLLFIQKQFNIGGRATPSALRAPAHKLFGVVGTGCREKFTARAETG
jgi:hypothetical protein